MTEYKVVVDEYKTVRWCKPGTTELHRVDGPAYEGADGSKQWYLNGKLHRVDGPAVEWAGGDKEWYLNGKRHRVDGPAVEWVDGSKSWLLNGTNYTEQEWQKQVGQNCEGKTVVIDGVEYELKAKE